jgi:hypothetical protein
MKRILIVLALLLGACDKTPPPKIAEPQIQELDKAKGVEQTLQKGSEAEKKNIDDAVNKPKKRS